MECPLYTATAADDAFTAARVDKLSAAVSTKPEVHNVLHRRQRRTELRPQTTCIETGYVWI